MPSLDTILNALGAGWLGTVLGALGLLYAYYLYRKSLQRPRIIYKVRGVTVIGRRFLMPTGLRIDYLGQQVESLNRSWAIIWNHGNKELTTANVSQITPISIVCREGRILEAKIVKKTTAANNTSVVGTDEGDYRIEFDYFNPGDGVTVEVLHSGEDSKIEVVGEFIGANPIKKALTVQDFGSKPIEKTDLLPYEGPGAHLAVFFLVACILFVLSTTVLDIHHGTLDWLFERLHGSTAEWLIGKAFLAFFWVMGIGTICVIGWIWMNSGWRHPRALSVTAKDM